MWLIEYLAFLYVKPNIPSSSIRFVECISGYLKSRWLGILLNCKICSGLMDIQELSSLMTVSWFMTSDLMLHPLGTVLHEHLMYTFGS